MVLPCKSDSFTFRRNVSASSSTSSTRSSGMEHCRRKLENAFEDSSQSNPARLHSDRSYLSTLSFNDNTKKVFRNGADKISKTFNTFRTTIGTITQRFKISTKRRQILEEGPMTPNCATPYSRQVLGRTPTKMYSPFGIESPYHSTTYDKENVPPNFKNQPSKQLQYFHEQIPSELETSHIFPSNQS